MTHRYLEEPSARVEVIAALVAAKFPTKAAAARAAGLHPNTLQGIVTGRRAGTRETLSALADALGVPLDAIADTRKGN